MLGALCLTDQTDAGYHSDTSVLFNCEAKSVVFYLIFGSINLGFFDDHENIFLNDQRSSGMWRNPCKVEAPACSLHQILSALFEKRVRDLITKGIFISAAGLVTLYRP